MKKILELITEEMKQAFVACGYDESYARVTLSNRPDLCEYQCNGAMAAAKAYKMKPIDIANGVVEKLQGSKTFEEVNAVMPGFINLKLNGEFLAEYMNGMANGEKLGMDPVAEPKTVIVDYGGANVAKPLHVGHLRAAVIGEAIKRMGRFVGHTVIGDVHLGDWGLQMGLIIEELKDRKPELPYFDESFTGEYPAEAPFTISELEEIYPAASGKSKVDEAFKERAQEATFKLQSGYAPYRAIWNHIMNVSLKDLKKNLDDSNNFEVSFEYDEDGKMRYLVTESEIKNMNRDMMERLSRAFSTSRSDFINLDNSSLEDNLKLFSGENYKEIKIDRVNRDER